MTRACWLALAAVAACEGPRVRAAEPVKEPAPVSVVGKRTDTRFVTRDQMLAGGELQISGEPLAEAMGRTLTSYSRDQLPVNLYFDPALETVWLDLPGFSTGIESYEYSRQPMNSVAFESGAGTSLVHTSVVNPDGARGPAATARLAALVQHYAAGSNARGKWIYPTSPINLLGWPGIWPTAHVFDSFDPAIEPTSAFGSICTVSSDDGFGGVGRPMLAPDYECDATTLHLRDRAAQIDPVLTPSADGFSAWKYGLWVLNYLQLAHDANDQPQTEVGPGSFLGSSAIEGFQAQLLLLQLDSRAEDWLSLLTTADGTTLSGFASRAEALAYDHTSPLRWFPGRIAVTETDDGSGFPRPSYGLASANSDLLGLVGMAMGYAEAYALTDLKNKNVGGAATARLFFDGDPFPADDQRANGDPTLHDRSLAMMRVALVALDRLHTDPRSGLLVDDVTMAGTTPARGQTISTMSAAYTVLGLRLVLRSLGSQLELYSNNTPDMAPGPTLLDAFPLRYPGAPDLTFTARVKQIVRAHADLLLDRLTDANGRAWAGWNVVTGTPADGADGLDAHTAAIRGLFASYLATGDTRYRERAVLVFERMQRVFYDREARIHAATAVPVSSVEYTPVRFGLLQSALRDMYLIVASRPGNEALALEVEELIGRLNKLVLNGWDDRDRDQRGHAAEYSQGLQMAERILSGESGRREGGSGPPTTDRDQDGVPEIDDARLPAALAASVTFEIVRP